MTNYGRNIHNSHISIYDPVDMDDSDLYVPTDELETILCTALIGMSLAGLPLRTRSKVVKAAVCGALGYPVPSSFRKTQPRFPGQNFDVYTQKSLNLQIWNEEIDPLRRYVLIHTNNDDVITKVRVITGEQLAVLDNTGTLTTKYQATMRHYPESTLFSEDDTAKIQSIICGRSCASRLTTPNALPLPSQLLPIREVYNRLLPLVGRTIHRINALQERNRGAELHSMICELLGYQRYSDDGTYPDILNQLLEIKLQTSPTIDLGLHSPCETQPFMYIRNIPIISSDIRYVIVDGTIDRYNDAIVHLNCLYVVNGDDFPDIFPLFGGKVQNAKIQLPLPVDFFD